MKHLATVLRWLSVVGFTLLLNASSPPSAPNFRAAVDQVQKAAHQHPEYSVPYFAALEAGFRDLQMRYPHEPEVYAELLFVADHTTGEASLRLVREILSWPAPSDIHEKAAGVRRKKEAVGQPYDRDFTTTDGRKLRLSDWRGKVVLLDFWATWCPPCREKMPEVQALYSRYHAQGFECLGVSFDDDLGQLRAFVREHQIPWSQVADGRGWEASPRARELGLTSLPSMWLLDRQGRLVSTDARSQLTNLVTALLKDP